MFNLERPFIIKKKRGINLKKIAVLLIIIVFFLFGWYSNNHYKKMFDESNTSFYDEKQSPMNRILDKQILVYNSMVVLNVSGVEWAKYTDTNSMDPLLGKDANGLELKPENENDITVGDIVVYEPKWTYGLLAHRVISIEKDEQGIYYTIKGDNSDTADPEKVRFNQISGVLVGVLY